ncbi:LysR family transcriptional regulator [Bradyrhizobium quebecense]|uniref:LysR substrate-binding domain-containing protein n=2 Tax=Bradyrhizobium quebecense TaxID=2748629 RepID=A0ACD3V7N3_9BRAD|nr:LysR family transcriptional regulator [Bradyrhizobium quebecense]UGY02508.1 LysR substrate-binding domain-containing protein [Bradyrhizobium quebecense]
MTNSDNRHQAPCSKTLAIRMQHLRFAMAAADCGSLRRAAEMFSVKHSVLSRSIGELEHLIGTALFERSSGGVKATPAGRSVLRIARLVMEQVDTLVEIGRSTGKGEAGRLAIGFATGIAGGELRATLSEFNRRAPSVDLAAIERSRFDLADALRNGTVDIAITPGRVLLPDVEIRALWCERILLALPENHPLTAFDTIAWKDLSAETIILGKLDRERDIEDLLISKLKCFGARPRLRQHDVGRNTVEGLTGLGIGVSLTLESDSRAGSAGLVYRELWDDEGPSKVRFFAHWQADNDNQALRRFVRLLAEHYPSVPDGN